MFIDIYGQTYVYNRFNLHEWLPGVYAGHDEEVLVNSLSLMYS